MEPADESAFAEMNRAHLADRFLPLGSQPRPQIAISGALEIRQRGTVVFALLGINDAQPLGAPKPGGEIRMALLQPLRRRLRSVVAYLFERFIVRTADQFRQPLRFSGLNE